MSRRCSDLPSLFASTPRLQQCTDAQTLLALRFPRPQTGPRTPILWKRGFKGPKSPISLRPHTGWKREFSVKKSPFLLRSLAANKKKKDFFRKILASVKFQSAILGPEMGASILRTPGKNTFFLQNPMSIKIPCFRGGGVFWFLGGGGGSADFIFMGARIFLTF